MGGGGAAGLHGGSQRAAAASLLRGDPRNHPEFADGREVRHRPRFYQSSGVQYRLARLAHQIIWTVEPFVRHNSRGDHVDQQLKQMMKELGEAINESLADSEAIAEVVSRIKEGGYDIFLVLEATIGVNAN